MGDINTAETCLLCGHKDLIGKRRSTVDKHPLTYEPSITILLCRSCHIMVSNYERDKDRYDLNSARFAFLDLYEAIKQRKVGEKA